MSEPGGPPLAVVLVTHNSGGHVGQTLGALAAQTRPGDELVVVDNASTDHTAEAVRSVMPDAMVIEHSRNLGFAAGANAGAAATTAPLLLLLNPDAVPRPGCLDVLRAAAGAHPDWAAWQPLVTMDRGERVNTSGGVVHFLGMGWAGQCGEPLAAAPTGPAEVGFASGAALVVRRPDWEAAGGFDERYFMYGEDLDLGLRLWLSGRGVGVVPAARVEHDYEFAKGERKWLLLERNRWWTVLADYPTGLLVLLLPALLAAELALLAVAARDGWLGSKLRAQAAVMRDLPRIHERRRAVQSRREVSSAQLAARLSAGIESPYLRLGPRLEKLQRAYWSLVTLLLRRASPRTSARSPESSQSTQ